MLVVAILLLMASDNFVAGIVTYDTIADNNNRLLNNIRNNYNI